MRFTKVVSSLLLCFICNVSAGIIHIPQDYLTIQAGIDAAVNGDTVLIADGLYSGSGNKDISFMGKAITVKSENGPESCLIDCNGIGRGFVFNSGEGNSSLLEGVTITNGSKAYGGAILCDGASPSIENCKLIHNTATQNGGGIYCRNLANPELKECILFQNVSVNNGGGVFCEESSLIIISCALSENEARHGGGILCSTGSFVEVRESDICGNIAITRGGGIYYTEGSIRLTGCTLENNTSDDGGAIYGRDALVECQITDCVIRSNIAEKQGGGIFCNDDSKMVFRGCLIESNQSDNHGGGICSHGSPIFVDCDIINNSCGMKGGGYYSFIDEPFIDSCRISGNYAFTGGGGLEFTQHSSAIVNNSLIYGNRGGNGAGIACTSESNMLISNCIVMNNVAETQGKKGGGIYIMMFPHATIFNCLILDNEAEHGAGINVVSTDGGYVNIINCTIVANTASETGGGIELFDDDVLVQNCIVWDNVPDGIYFRAGGSTVIYSDIQEGCEGEGNINADPLFVPGPYGDVYLSSTGTGHSQDSRCIDRGSDTAENVCVTPTQEAICMSDFTTRIDYVTDTGIVDMGFHYLAFSPTPTPTSTPTASSTPIPSSTPTLTPTATPTTECPATGVTLWMPAHEFFSGDPCSCKVTVCNLSEADLESYPLFVILDVYGHLFFGPGFTDSLDNYLDQYPVFPPGETIVEVLREFAWPEGVGSASGIWWYAAVTTPEMTDIFGKWDSWEFGWSE